MLIGCSFLIVIAVFAADTNGFFDKRAPGGPSDAEQSEALVEPYREELRAAITAFESTKVREPFLQSLLTMRVPSDYLDMHVKLVIAADGEEYSEQELLGELTELRAEYTWLQ